MRFRFRLTAAFGALILFAVAAVLSGLDRLSEYRPAATKWVPEPFRIGVSRQLAREALANGQWEMAKANARNSIARDPADAESVGLYGASLQLAGNAVEARKAFAVAGAMGWREPLTQLYWMSAAIEERNFSVASQRLDAVLRQTPDFAGHADLLAVLEASPEGRDQLANRLADAPAWRETYFAEAYTLMPSAQIMRADVARRMAEGHGFRDCPLAAKLVTALANSRQYDIAHQVWQAHCRHPQDGPFLTDPGFTRADPTRQQTAFDWFWSDDGAISLTVGPKHGFDGLALTVESSSPRETAFATQLMVLPAGSYTAVWQARDSNGAPATGVVLSVSCNQDLPDRKTSELRDALSALWEAAFTVPADCPAQWLSLRIAPGSRTVTVDSLSIARR